MKIKCTNCKKEIDSKDAFCSFCGAKVVDEKDSVAKEVSTELIITNAMKIPGVKVNRKEFLAKIFANENVDIDKILEVGPIEANCSKRMLRKIANKIVLTRTSESSIVSFAAGIPGGLAMAATIPADTLQFFGMTLRLAQELTYLYGLEDLWKNGEVDYEKVQGQLIMYCGVMFGVTGAAQGVRLLATQLAKQSLKQIPKKALTKTVWYPIVKQVAKTIGIKMTKDVAAKGLSKAIPILGGIVSGGITFASMNPMGKRLIDVLEEANFEYSEAKAQKDFEELEELVEENPTEVEMDMDFSDEEVIESEETGTEESEEETTDDILATIEKLASLKDKGILSEEEFASKKAELMARL